MISAKSWAHLKVFLNFILEFLFFTVRISLLYLLLQFPQVVLLVVQHALFITAFLKWMIDVISFCLYLLNEMRRNLIKITSHAIFRWFTCFDRFCHWCHLWFKFTASDRSLAIQHFYIDHNAPCLPPPKILHNHLFPISLRDCHRPTCRPSYKNLSGNFFKQSRNLHNMRDSCDLWSNCMQTLSNWFKMVIYLLDSVSGSSRLYIALSNKQ